MAENKRNEGTGHQGRPAKEKGQGSGQQTAGLRGQQEKQNEEHYRRSERKQQRGNHGGNR